MGNLDQQYQDFIVQQQAILAQYQEAAAKLMADRQYLTSQAVQRAKGLQVIEEGNLPQKVQAVDSLTDATGNFTTAAFSSTNLPLTVLRLDLRNARKLRLRAQVQFNSARGEFSPYGVVGIMGSLATDLAAYPKISDYTLYTIARPGFLSDDNILDTDFLFFSLDGDIECVGNKFAYLIFPVFYGDGFVSNSQFISLSTYQLIG